MGVKNPSLGWEKLKDVYYRNRELCQLSLPKEDQYKLIISTTVLAIEVEESIRVFQYKGEQLGVIELNKLPSELVCYELDSFDEGSLVLALSDRIRVYHNWSPLLFQDFLLPDTIQDKIWDYKNRVLVLSSSQDLFYFDGLGLQVLLKNTENFTLLTKNHWHCNEDIVVLLDLDHVFHLNIKSLELVPMFMGETWHTVSVSPRGLVCLFNAKTNELRIYKDSKTKLMELNLETQPNDMAWCGDDTIACAFNHEEIRLYGPDSEYVTFWYPDEIIVLRGESNGLRLITSEKVELISKVQQFTSNIFLMGSTEPSAILLDSVNLLSTQAPRALENLKIINLDQGVAECLDAALEELDPYWQKKLLAAAAFGKSSLPKNTQLSKVFVETCNKLRVLNVLTEMGIILTSSNLLVITLDGLIARLIKTGNFYECIQICKFLKDRGRLASIFKSWANAKIAFSADLDDEDLFKVIIRLAEGLSVQLPLAEIGLAAFSEGRPALAKQLVLKEPLPDLELPSLLELDEHELALKEGRRRGIPGMIMSILLILQKQLTTSQFTKVIMLVMQDNQLYTYYARHDDEFLFDFYRQTDQLSNLAHHIWDQEVRNQNPAEYLRQVEELYNRDSQDILIKNDQSLLHRQSELYEFQRSISHLLQVDLENMNLDGTIELLIKMKLDKQLNSLIKKFKVTDRKIYHIKCRVLTQQDRFDDLFKFAQERKSPIGYHPFFKYCLKQKRKKEAAVYVRMISGIPYEKRIEMYLRCESYNDAINLASKEKDIPSLKNIYKTIPPNQPQLKALVNEAMSKL
ncbi:tethering complex subunit VPS16 [Lachancea thermotolerans CBS 6340]|uniref:Probable vacuolar protein sorting-associated protein 16 homolog n=1 Tax=Lachancea thermotolerans (strain ATCC 56472 / CBS 6340 / NRRL Y-8284) TaxID=559295 RepID=C5DIC6_LACTC|nr:KLTH0E11462p [Lachancea thermotolerans CBS 6340]CAR23537.1 KLTH0E11462p [Lachancea thermotolerans CBS 6340]